ncbi:dual specificity tyrosine-phosphorylation-regulated kinase 1A [Anopheles funestus]|uniref:Uncharacterized protein n=1 Tax=Anopheles funestus TaxID=62324 RepID=A0A182RJR8_ANOFN|nr:dual specificity tyrosine-phosphorylation-regulated kinase 1A [Anopheles funestus]XP_049295027.1 dual specificity tyrosine-phosphorylation-regulated kinase 1A [Anopheles funestus]XP_049295028.1 dual specificity tyrosine-phosphorylation-regulated kinase 1A [Anopheles funestus]XP_049295029.1 dual specificity tyrosine-phosphorylation-regulated kinase 1A [Anopheles funestus]XP_049295030.1 dual specificity tyrosine-phosphorylation-regulated kinase 1A [Anopheles funestus]XP_049295031.1 dual speci
MHFWIDKRSQACGFGRARVAASLSGGGGLGFGHPRRVPRKSMVTPIHRFQTVDCGRPHIHRQQQSQQQQPHPQPQSNPSVPGTHYSSTQSQQSSAHQHQQPHHPHQSHADPQHHRHHPHHPHHHQGSVQQQSQPNNQQQQQVHQVQLHLSGQYNSQSSILPAPTPYPQPSPNLQQSSSPNALNYHVPVSMNHIYSASTQSSGAEIDGISNVGQHIQPHVGHDAQLLPAHLKCGMWASLALATVFVAGAKFYFDHQGTGLEVLIFCAFSATFFLAACTVSLWRRPRDIQITSNNMISDTISNAEQSSLQNNPEFLSSNPSPLLNGSAGSGPLGGLVPGNIQQASLASIVAPPPPYHIAILLPDTSKEAEEAPPPSYDKIVI